MDSSPESGQPAAHPDAPEEISRELIPRELNSVELRDWDTFRSSRNDKPSKTRRTYTGAASSSRVPEPDTAPLLLDRINPNPNGEVLFAAGSRAPPGPRATLEERRRRRRLRFGPSVHHPSSQYPKGYAGPSALTPNADLDGARNAWLDLPLADRIRRKRRFRSRASSLRAASSAPGSPPPSPNRSISMSRARSGMGSSAWLDQPLGQRVLKRVRSKSRFRYVDLDAEEANYVVIELEDLQERVEMAQRQK